MIICSKCGRRFRGEKDLKLFAEVQTAADDIGVVPLSECEDPISFIFRGCPNCRSEEYLTYPKPKYKRKYRRGGHILSLDELARQEFIYWHDKITHSGWFMSWQFRMAARYIGENGCIYYAIKNHPDQDESQR